MNLRNENLKSGGAAFTLLELLTVITIIAILAAASFTGMSMAINSANRVVAKSDANSVTLAISAYKSEYHVMPVRSSGRSESVETESNSSVMKVLLGVDRQLNPKQIPFMNVNLAKNGRKGLDRDGNYKDPWGENYGVAIDADYNHAVDSPDPSGGTIHSDAIAWSYGKPARNGQRAPYEKWVKSWE